MPTILLVDDEESDRKLMKAILQASGYNVVEACDSQQATRLFTEHLNEIKMLVTDIALPGENGCEMARAMAGIKTDMNILFVSGHAGAEICRFYGFPVSDLHFLRKPFTAREFVDRVKYLLDGREMLPQTFLVA